VDFPDGHAEGSGSLTLPGGCGVVRPVASFAKQCNGTVNVNVSYPSSAPDATSAEVYGHDAGGGVHLVVGIRVAPGSSSDVTVKADWTAGVDVRQNGVQFASAGTLPLPAGCPGAGAPPPAGPTGTTGTTANTSGGGGARGETQDANPSASSGPTPSAAGSVTSTGSTRGTATSSGPAGLVIAGDDSLIGTVVVSSTVVIVLAAAGLFVALTFRRRRVDRLAGAGAGPISTVDSPAPGTPE
jgi:hypothetical protein